jgi:hypothetical protein
MSAVGGRAGLPAGQSDDVKGEAEGDLVPQFFFAAAPEAGPAAAVDAVVAPSAGAQDSAAE